MSRPGGVREAVPEEAERVAAAYAWLFAPPGSTPPDWDAERAAGRLRAVMGDERSTVLVADDLSGFATVYLDIASVRFGQRAWVEDLAVDPGRRSVGVGRALLEAAKGWARSRGATHLELDSADGRVDAHRFYAREGMDGGSTSFRCVL